MQQRRGCQTPCLLRFALLHCPGQSSVGCSNKTATAAAPTADGAGAGAGAAGFVASAGGLAAAAAAAVEEPGTGND
ncbi:unnamed protein product [Closterium sp. NIES-54]